MLNYLFYLEYETHAAKRRATRARLGQHLGNVVAIDTTTRGQRPDGKVEGFTSIYQHADSAVTWEAVTPVFLRTKCLRISEATARKIHPRLFSTLD